jgi:hypothetical protein
MTEGHQHIPGMETLPRMVSDSKATQIHQERKKPQLYHMLLPSPTKDKEKRQEGVTFDAKYTAPLPEETPQEREERKKRFAEEQKKWDYAKTPEGKREFVATLVRQAKKRGVLPPDLDHLWLNLPSGWAEYTESYTQKLWMRAKAAYPG